MRTRGISVCEQAAISALVSNLTTCVQFLIFRAEMVRVRAIYLNFVIFQREMVDSSVAYEDGRSEQSRPCGPHDPEHFFEIGSVMVLPRTEGCMAAW